MTSPGLPGPRSVGCPGPPGDFFVEAGGGVTMQVTRYSFYFERSGIPQAPFQRIPLLGATLDLDAGYRFP